MRFAALECSTEWCGVALWRDGEIAALERRAGNRHSELALPMLQGLLRKFSINVEELDAVAFGAGPGSFTGLRIACGLAQGLAFARELPVLGVSSLEALARGIRRRSAWSPASMRACAKCIMRRSNDRPRAGARSCRHDALRPSRCAAAGWRLGRLRQRLRAFTETWDSPKCCLKCIPPRSRWRGSPRRASLRARASTPRSPRRSTSATRSP